MKKYRLKNLADDEIVGVFKTKAKAIAVMNDLVDGINETNGETVENGLSQFDFALDVIEDVDDEIDLFEHAIKHLSDKCVYDSNTEDLSTLTREANPHHIKALIALNRLFTIAEAWNDKCGFVPDFSNEKQNKWFPFFSYNKSYSCFMCSSIRLANADMSASIGARLCFATEDIAEQFGKRLINLYNQVLSLNGTK